MTIDEGLRAAGANAARGEITFPGDLHGFPGTVHGGAVAALFIQLARPQLPVHLRMDLVRGVPTATPIRLTTGSAGAEARLGLSLAGRPLAGGELSRSAEPPSEAEPVRRAWARRGPPGTPPAALPATATCLACGTSNPLGLGLRLQADDRWLWAEHRPGEAYRTGGSTAHPALAAVGLDELGWWLGALAQGECGVTTEIALTLARPIPIEPLLFLGDRGAVRTDADPRGRYCRATGYLYAGTGELLAAATVRFAGSRAYTKRLLGPFLQGTDLDTLARFFPSAGRMA